MRAVNQVHLLQLDSVNVLVRSHYLPVFSRLGPYRRELLDRVAWGQPRKLVEYWGHAACLMPIELHPLLRWRMDAAHRDAWGGIRRIAQERPDYVTGVLAALRAHGPLTAGQLEDILEHGGPRPTGTWWDWRDTKVALEWLLWSGQVGAASRRNFERIYDVIERIIPADISAAPTPNADDACRELVRRSSRALGVATEADLRDYFRLSQAQSRQAIRELVEAGELLPVAVDGWRQPSYLNPAVTLPRSSNASALLSPFDSLIWFRARTERLWDFRYRLEFYTPAPKRVHGYYVLPFLLGEHLVARVDVKADRQAGELSVLAAYSEKGSAVDEIAGPLAKQLVTLGSWLGLAGVRLGVGGDLIGALHTHLR